MHNYTNLKLAVWLENVLIYSTTTKIKLLDIKNNHTEVIQNDVNCTVLTAAKDYLYYGNNLDNNRERILKTLISNKKTDMIIELGKYGIPVRSSHVSDLNNFNLSNQTR